MNDFLRRLTLLSLIPRQPGWEDPDCGSISNRASGIDGSSGTVSGTGTSIGSGHPPPRPGSSGQHPQREPGLPAIGGHSGKISAPALFKAIQERGFQGNLRAVQRDLVFLAKLFPELQNDGARSGGLGWFWRRDAAVLDLPALDPTMALTFVLARDLLRPLLPPLLLRRLSPYFEAADRILAATGTTALAHWKDRVRVIANGQPLLHATIDPDVMAVIQTALLEGKHFKGRYQPCGRDLAEYEFNPLGLVYRERVVYLVATLWDYTDPRQFAMHRFTQAEPMAQAATRPDGFDLDGYIATGAFDYPNADSDTASPIHLQLRMGSGAASHLQETPLSTDQQIADDLDIPGWVSVTATVQETEQLYWWLLGFGAHVEVLAPARLRQRMVTNAEALARRYGLNGHG